MAENKTRITAASVNAFIDLLPEPRRSDARALVKIMQSISRQKPKMWGPSIVGFGSHHYRYDTGREGDMPLICFSPRRSSARSKFRVSSDRRTNRSPSFPTTQRGHLHFR
jgi:hypothetical protein